MSKRDEAEIETPRLVETAEGLALKSGDMMVRGDFARLLPRLREGSISKEMLVKAARIKGVSSPLAIDATAGLGEDSILLAAAGFEVIMFEQNEIIGALLEDALARANNDDRLAQYACRMQLVKGDSIERLGNLDRVPDVVFLDPMFPAKRKDAAAKKKLQLFQMIESPCSNEQDLLDAAIHANPRKVVVKRPAKGPVLAGMKPSYCIAGKAVRYDCLALR